MFTLKSTTDKLLDTFNIPKITAGVMVYNSAEYLEYSIKSIYHLLNQIIIIDGRVKLYDEGKISSSSDGTIDIINRLKEIDYLNKIEFISSKKIWDDKIEKQNAIAKMVKGEYYLKLDFDEIWKPETLVDAINFMRDNNIDVLNMPFFHFWLSFNRIANDAGGKWTTSHPRIWKWRNGFCHVHSFNYFNDSNGNKVASPKYNVASYKGEDRIYHFGYVRKLNEMITKINYYGVRGIEKFVTDTVTKWKNNKSSTQPTQKVDSWAEDFAGILPEVLNNHPYKDISDVRETK